MDYLNRWKIIGEPLGKGGQGVVYKVIDTSKFRTDIESGREIRESIHRLSVPIRVQKTEEENYAIFRKAIIDIFEMENPSCYGALKVLQGPEDARDNERAEERIEREIKAMSEIQHPNLLKILDFDPDSKWFVSKYYPKGTLFDNEDRFIGDFVKSLRAFRKIVEGVSELHKQGYVHRDIKPQNVFIDAEDNLVLGDFGLVYYKERDYDRISDSLESVGSRDWMPPWAMGRGSKEIKDIKPVFDVFSLGKLLWSMVSGRILPHTYFDDTDYQDFNLEKLHPKSPSIQFANPLLNKCIVERESKCLSDVSVLLEEIDKVLFSIDNKADWSDPNNIKIQCRVCGIGYYQIRIDVNERPRAREFGLIEGDHIYKIFACNHCGNVQIFALNAGKQTPKAWNV